MKKRQLVISLIGLDSERTDQADILIYSSESEFEIVVTEQRRGDASIFLSHEQCLEIVNTLNKNFNYMSINI